MTLIPVCLRSCDTESYGASFSRRFNRVAANPYEDWILQRIFNFASNTKFHAGSRQLAP